MLFQLRNKRFINFSHEIFILLIVGLTNSLVYFLDKRQLFEPKKAGFPPQLLHVFDEAVLNEEWLVFLVDLAKKPPNFHDITFYELPEWGIFFGHFWKELFVFLEIFLVKAWIPIDFLFQKAYKLHCILSKPDYI